MLSETFTSLHLTKRTDRWAWGKVSFCHVICATTCLYRCLLCSRLFCLELRPRYVFSTKKSILFSPVIYLSLPFVVCMCVKEVEDEHPCHISECFTLPLHRVMHCNWMNIMCVFCSLSSPNLLSIAKSGFELKSTRFPFFVASRHWYADDGGVICGFVP